MSVGKNIPWKKRGREAISSSIQYYWLFGRISSGEEEKGTEIFWKIIKIIRKNLSGGRISSCREIYTPPGLDNIWLLVYCDI